MALRFIWIVKNRVYISALVYYTSFTLYSTCLCANQKVRRIHNKRKRLHLVVYWNYTMMPLSNLVVQHLSYKGGGDKAVCFDNWCKVMYTRTYVVLTFSIALCYSSFSDPLHFSLTLSSAWPPSSFSPFFSSLPLTLDSSFSSLSASTKTLPAPPLHPRPFARYSFFPLPSEHLKYRSHQPADYVICMCYQIERSGVSGI